MERWQCQLIVFGVLKLRGNRRERIIDSNSNCRSILNFQIGGDSELMPKEIIMAMAIIKKAAARVNTKLNGLDPQISEAIQTAADEVPQLQRDSLTLS